MHAEAYALADGAAMVGTQDNLLADAACSFCWCTGGL